MDTDNPMTVLVVDDSLSNTKLIEMTLVREGYRVLTALNGPDGRALAKKEQPNLILLDIKMPGEDGFDVIQKLKQSVDTTAIPVIFLTGESEIDTKLKGFELGAVDYITKPFHNMEVSARVRLHLKLSIATNSLIMSQAEKLKQITEAQVSMLTTPEMVPDARFGVLYIALQEAGGDFYDVLRISNSIFGYFVADFSGHDIQTSYMTSSIKALLKQNCSPVFKPQETIRLINNVLIEILPEGKYLTACYAHLNRKSRELSIISAGHPPAVYVPKDGKPELIVIEGDILGIFKDVLFGERVIRVSPGDRLFIYSDGLIEDSIHKTLWVKGAEKMVTACDNLSDYSIEETPELIKTKLMKDSDEIDDDVCILGIEV